MPTKVNSPRPHPWLLIALHSPNAVPETGLGMAFRRKAGQCAPHCRAVRSPQSRLSWNNREIRALFAYFGAERAKFLCSPDCVAERAVSR
jgi:hypothetical protein